MTSFIIVSSDKEKRMAYCTQFAVEHTINTFDSTIIEKDTDSKTTTKSIGIESIKNVQKKLLFKPLKSKDKLVIIEDAQLLTPEAQNALLKSLEEPPEHTFIILAADSQEAFLPTIRSRCQIIELETEKPVISEKERTAILTVVEELPTMSLGEKLKLAEQLAKDKDKAVLWIERLITILHEQLLQTANEESHHSLLTSHSSLLTSFQSLHTILKTTNINPRFAIEHTLLTI